MRKVYVNENLEINEEELPSMKKELLNKLKNVFDIDDNLVIEGLTYLYFVNLDKNNDIVINNIIKKIE